VALFESDRDRERRQHPADRRKCRSDRGDVHLLPRVPVRHYYTEPNGTDDKRPDYVPTHSPRVSPGLTSRSLAGGYGQRSGRATPWRPELSAAGCARTTPRGCRRGGARDHRRAGRRGAGPRVPEAAGPRDVWGQSSAEVGGAERIGAAPAYEAWLWRMPTDRSVC
jgi:hypothetical protein